MHLILNSLIRIRKMKVFIESTLSNLIKFQLPVELLSHNKFIFLKRAIVYRRLPFLL
jgi:hypothetical protein